MSSRVQSYIESITEYRRQATSVEPKAGLHAWAYVGGRFDTGIKPNRQCPPLDWVAPRNADGEVIEIISWRDAQRRARTEFAAWAAGMLVEDKHKKPWWQLLAKTVSGTSLQTKYTSLLKQYQQ